MTTNYAKHVSKKVTPQTEAIPGEKQVKNTAGGFVYEIDKFSRLRRFLILGTEGGTYYASERTLTKENATCITDCIAENPTKTLQLILEVSDGGLAKSNDPALFALALCLCNETTKKEAANLIPKIARIGTHLQHLASYIHEMRGWGRVIRNGFSNWFNEKDNNKLSYQLAKYQSRDGWSMGDILRLAHPKQAILAKNLPAEITGDRERIALLRFALKGTGIEPELRENLTGSVDAMLKAHASKKADIKLITDAKLTHEMIPNEWKNDPEVWEALLQNMPLTATIRNLAKMTSIGLLKPLSAETKKIVSRLNDKEYVKKSRIHPLSVLSAIRVYESGHGDKGSLSWTPVNQIESALEDAFYLAFDNIEPTGKNYLLGLDISGSMGSPVSGVSGLTSRDVTACMAMVTMRKEENSHIMGFGNSFHEIEITAKTSLQTAIAIMSGKPFGSTDCSLPMLYAIENKLDVDAFCVYTDNETYAGSMHPSQALRQYRSKMNKQDAKLAVVATTPTQFSIADPQDINMMDFVGFDPSAPAIMNKFVAGTL